MKKEEHEIRVLRRRCCIFEMEAGGFFSSSFCVVLKVLLLFILFILFNLRKQHLLAGSPFLFFPRKSINFIFLLHSYYDGDFSATALKTLDDNINFPTN
ncbi:hypothetical protein EUGRSUZ_C01420 [Eucalyptus grandis]|uniref:Uncharacterized protein n=2 Tax=Eucalyptus grandis TaxID=71139 RepID=A0ACC3LDD1_EUCGR|nr:hypothetical protein EUGRSUZ_C01420 [Eucalyptus grandis]